MQDSNRTPPQLPGSPAAVVFLNRDHDRVSTCLVQADGMVLPTDSITTWRCATRRRHELLLGLAPGVAMLFAGWVSIGLVLCALTALAWWRWPRLHELQVTLRQGQHIILLRSSEGLRVAELTGALARALAHRRTQSERAVAAASSPILPPQPAWWAHEPAWRNTDFDQIRDSGLDAMDIPDPGQGQGVDIPL